MGYEKREFTVDAVRLYVGFLSGGDCYTNDMVVQWLEENKHYLSLEYIGADIKLTETQAMYAAIGVHQQIMMPEIYKLVQKTRLNIIKRNTAPEKCLMHCEYAAVNNIAMDN